MRGACATHTYRFERAGEAGRNAGVEDRRGSEMTKPTLSSLSGLTAGDAEWFDQVAAGKRAAAAATRDPAQAAQLDAEAALACILE